MKIAVTGANGQLGQSLNKIKDNFPHLDLDFYSQKDWDITHREIGLNILRKEYDLLINCAAYTAVDNAESNADLCYKINALSVRRLAESCRDLGIHLIHISTDYVYHNARLRPLKETDYCCPQGVYASSKLRGEEAIQETFDNYTIIRTSWVYSEFGHNFVKSMLKLSEQRKELSIVHDQHGVPTYASELARVCLELATKKDANDISGTYNYSSEGWATWYEFAKEIFKLSKIDIACRPIPSSQYPTPAKRPQFSVLNLGKIRPFLNVGIPNWRNGLKTCLHELGRLS